MLRGAFGSALSAIMREAVFFVANNKKYKLAGRLAAAPQAAPAGGRRLLYDLETFGRYPACH